MELFEVMRTTGSVRRFLPDPVPETTLYRVLDAARFAASGGNRQGWRVVIVREPGQRTALADLYRRQEAPPPPAPDAGPAAHRTARNLRFYAEHLHELPLQIVVTVELSALRITDAGLDRPSIIGGASIYPFVQNILLALRHEGLGATLTTRVVHDEPAVMALLGIPEGHAVAAHLGVGWPAEPHPTRLRRQPVEQFATFDTFDGTSLEPPLTLM